jgi:GT2 family glycosyltransferase
MIESLGASLGNTLMAAKPENPKGFWENELVVQLNDQILDSLGARWDIPPLEPWDEQSDFVFDRFSEIAKQLIAAEFDAAEFISIKDPRLASLLPFWIRVLKDLGYATRVIQIVRNPTEVFLSVNERNGFTRKHSDTLWLDSVDAILNAQVGDILLINHSSVGTNDEQILHEISAFLDLPASGVASALATFRSQCYDPSLRHFTSTTAATTDSTADVVYQLFAAYREPVVLDAGRLAELRESFVQHYSQVAAFKSKLDIYLTAISSVNSVRKSLQSDARAASLSAKAFGLFEATLRVDQGGEVQPEQLLKKGTFVVDEAKALRERIKCLEFQLESMASRRQVDSLASERRFQNALKRFLNAVDQRREVELKIKEIENRYHQLEEHFYSIDKLRNDLSDWKGAFTEQAIDFGRQYEHVIEQLWQTTRWKVGDRVVELANRMVGRHDDCESKSVLKRIQEEYRHWGQCLAKDYLPPAIDNLLDSESENAEQSNPQPLILEGATITSKDDFATAAENHLTQFLSQENTLDFTNSDKPEVSIILVLYNRAELTLCCLQSLLENTQDVSIQLILVDNASSDRTDQLLERVSGAHTVRNRDNVGFLRACNQALGYVAAEQTLFLNNDALVSPGSIRKASDTLIRRPDVGAVGAKIVALDGMLQEAGSTCWSNGTCFGYGRGEDPMSFQFLFEREVDYCSGAFLQTRTELLKQLGGFDEQFAPAYYEDTDYCLTLNDQGYKVLYDPQVVIRHYEFGSSEGSDYATELSNRNQQKFLAKHRLQLANHRSADSLDISNGRYASAWPAIRILYIDDRVPHMYFGSGFPRSNFIVNCLANAGYRVSVLPLNFPNEENATDLYCDLDRRIEVIPGIGRMEFLQYWQKSNADFDLVWVSRPHNMEFLHPIMGTVGGAKKLVYDAEAIFADRENALRQLGLGDPENTEGYEEMVHRELVLAAGADALVAVSRRDRDIIASHLSRDVPVIDCGYGVNIRQPKSGFEVRSGLLFVGNLDRSETPNADSLLWFYDLVWPLVKEKLPNVVLHVIGSNKADVLECIADTNIVFHGVVDDLSQFYDSAAVFIAPTRYAAGIPLKVQEAAANGVPTVVTDLLKGQLGWQHEKQTLSSEVGDPYTFAENCVRLHSDVNLWRSIQSNAFSAVENECNVMNFEKKILSMLDDILDNSSKVTMLSDYRESN